MAITVNGFGGGGGGEALRGDYCLKLINASSSVLPNITDSSNNTPAVSNMQKLLDIEGPGRLLLLAPYGNYATQSSAKGMVRIRVAADERIIYKACDACRLINHVSGTAAGESYSYCAVGDSLPPVILAPGFFGGPRTETLNVALETKTIMLRKDKFFPDAYILGQNNDDYTWVTTKSVTRDYSKGSSNCFHYHSLEDDNRIDKCDYWYSIFPDGLFFDDNLTIHAAYGYAPASFYKNGILVVYELFDE